MYILGPYRKPGHARSMLEIAITFGAFVGLWALAWTANPRAGPKGDCYFPRYFRYFHPTAHIFVENPLWGAPHIHG
jgi:hypothetical protein